MNDAYPLRQPWTSARAGRLAGRVVLWAVLAIVAVNGVVAIARQPKTPAAPPVPIPAAAEAFAQRVVQAWYGYDPAHPEEHAAAVNAVAPGLADPRSGAAAATLQTVAWTRPAGAYRDATGAVIVTVDAAVNARPFTFQVAVGPVGQGWALLGLPSVVPAAPVGAPRATPPNGDSASAASSRPTVLAFLRAWGSGTGDVSAYLAPGLHLDPLGGLTPVAMSLTVATGTGAHDAALAVIWQAADGGQMTAGYGLTLDQNGERWTIAAITPGANAPTIPPTPISLGE